VIDVATAYFAVEETDQLRIHNAEGREFLRETNATYDLIVMDAYKKDKVPFQLTTAEFMSLAHDRLDEDGVLLSNLISAPSGPASQFYRAEYKTISQVFPTVYVFPTVDAGVVQNIEVIATKNDTRLTEATLLERNERRDIGIDLADEIRTLAENPPTEDVPVLRDDRAPVDALLDPMVGQRYVIQETDEDDAARDDTAANGTENGNETDENGTKTETPVIALAADPAGSIDVGIEPSTGASKLDPMVISASESSRFVIAARQDGVTTGAEPVT
jgi:hypothetical protein